MGKLVDVPLRPSFYRPRYRGLLLEEPSQSYRSGRVDIRMPIPPMAGPVARLTSSHCFSHVVAMAVSPASLSESVQSWSPDAVLPARSFAGMLLKVLSRRCIMIQLRESGRESVQQLRK